MNKHFTHLHLHTDFSLLDGAIRIPQLVKFAKEQEWKAVGIADHGNIFGAIKLFQACQKENIKPILGCEFYTIPDASIKDVKEKYHHLVLIVENEEGYKNLCHLMAFSYKEGFYFKPRIDYKILQKHHKGLIASTACIGGHIPKLLRQNKEKEAEEQIQWFVDLFGPQNFFIEVQPPEYPKVALLNPKLFALADKFNLKTIATCDAHFLEKEMRETHEILLSVQTRNLFSDPKRLTFGEANCYLRTTNEMLKAFPEHEEAIWNTGEIADRCQFNFTFGKLFFPKFEIPQEYDEVSYFKFLCQSGLDKLKNNNLLEQEKLNEYDNRLNIEMDLIIEMGFVGYFLVVSDFVQWAKKQNISVGPGRGSAAGSLVAWALEITNVDPIKYNLLFERFLNPERVSMPDIDIDFCIEKREDVINYVKDKYGHDCVCQIITFGTMLAKGVIKDVARTLGFPFSDASAVTGLIPDQLKITIDGAIEQEPRLKEMIESNPKVKHLIEISKNLEGLTRHASKHAAGVVISPAPLEEMLPLYIPAKTNELVAQYTMTDLESIGFLKMDFLGLKNLTLVDRALTAIKKNHGVEIDLDKLELTDQKAFDLLRAGNTSGVFQFESEGIREVLRKLQPEKFEDLIAVNALYRPGPLGSGMVDDFIDRRHGRKKTTYMFKELEPVLAETYGVIVYQEQVMKIASAIAGYSLGAADILRRAMGKKKIEVMEQQKVQFIDGATKRNFDKKLSGELFDLMAYFAGYGFNKSHSTAYALIAYHTAYLKANFPHEFMAALVSFETNNPDKLTEYLQEISDMEIDVIPPCINKSQMEFSAQGKKILFGLQGIKNVGQAALENILEEREKESFKDTLDFCTRIDLRTSNKRVIESLIGTGAMDCFAGNRAQKTNELEKIISIALEKKEAAKTGQMNLFSNNENTEKKEENELYSFQPCDEWKQKIKLEKERELAGFYLSSHPLKSYQPITKWFNLPTFGDVLEKIKNTKSTKEFEVIAYGFMQNHREITTKKGSRMAFAQFEDFSSHCELIIFPKVFAKVETLLHEHKVFIIKGIVDLTATTKCKIKANEMIPVDLVFDDKKNIKYLNLELPEMLNENVCNEIKNMLPPGKTPINLLFNENQDKLQLRSTLKTNPTAENLKNMEKLGIKISCYL
jgi:DNA polymerase III subunit alpha